MYILIFVLLIILLMILVTLASINRKKDERIVELETKLYDENQIVKQKTEDFRKANLTVQTLEDSLKKSESEYKKLTKENLELNKIVQEKESTILALEDSLAKATIKKEKKVVAESKTIEEKAKTTKKTATKKITAKKTTTKKTTKKGE